jgi:threonine synthase
VQIAVPTGNFGNILAGYLAKRMGAPIRNLVLATNENDILSRFFNTGEYSISQVKRTLSPSMDIQVASNFERYLYYLLGKDTEAVKRYMSEFKHNGRIKVPFNLEETPFCADSANKQQTLGTIARYHQEHNYLLDPHTAAGVAVAERFVDDDCPMVCLATAHPAKFPDAVREAVGEDIATHPRIEGILELPTRCTVLPADKNAIESFIEKTLTEEHKD